MMTQISKQRKMTPKQAAGRPAAIDARLDADLFKALSDPTRLILLACLSKCGRACSVGEVAECCAVDMSVVSRHLSMMEDAGILQARKEGRTVFYSVRYRELTGMLRALADAIDQCCPGRSGKGGCCE